jgi:hypothetical protein
MFSTSTKEHFVESFLGFSPFVWFNSLKTPLTLFVLFLSSLLTMFFPLYAMQPCHSNYFLSSLTLFPFVKFAFSLANRFERLCFDILVCAISEKVQIRRHYYFTISLPSILPFPQKTENIRQPHNGSSHRANMSSGRSWQASTHSFAI